MALGLWAAWMIRLGAVLIGVLLVFSVLPQPAVVGANADCAIACEGHEPAMPAASANARCGTTAQCEMSSLCHSGDCLASPIAMSDTRLFHRLDPGLHARFERTQRVAFGTSPSFDPPPPRSFA